MVVLPWRTGTGRRQVPELWQASRRLRPGCPSPFGTRIALHSALIRCILITLEPSRLYYPVTCSVVSNCPDPSINSQTQPGPPNAEYRKTDIAHYGPGFPLNP